jgi:hypothetical protein
MAWPNLGWYFLLISLFRLAEVVTRKYFGFLSFTSLYFTHKSKLLKNFAPKQA